MIRFAAGLVRPYWKWLCIVAVAMVVETITALAGPWPLKIVLDSVFADEPAPAVLTWLVGASPDRGALLNVAVGGTVVIAVLQALSAYVAAYYTVSIGQWIAHDLRESVYAHLQRLSMAYYDKQQVGPIISMMAIMLSLNWRFTLTALALTPLLLVFVSRLRRAHEVLSGAMTAGALIVFITYLGRLFRPIQRWRVRARTSRRPASALNASAPCLMPTTACYDPSRPVLTNVSFRAGPGQR